MPETDTFADITTTEKERVLGGLVRTHQLREMYVKELNEKALRLLAGAEFALYLDARHLGIETEALRILGRQIGEEQGEV